MIFYSNPGRTNWQLPRIQRTPTGPCDWTIVPYEDHSAIIVPIEGSNDLYGHAVHSTSPSGDPLHEQLEHADRDQLSQKLESLVYAGCSTLCLSTIDPKFTT